MRSALLPAYKLQNREIFYFEQHHTFWMFDK